MGYTKTAWKDHIVDSSGAVVQQGTPLNAKNLLHIEEGIANASANDAGVLAAAAAHSGVLDMPGIRGVFTSQYVLGEVQVPGAAWMVQGQNILAYTPNSKFLILGNVLDIKAPTAEGGVTGVLSSAHRIDLPAPPTEGTRDDLVFLEAWRDSDTQEWKTRFRVVTDIDFNVNPEGMRADGTSWDKTKVTAQGGKPNPLPGLTGTPDQSWYRTYFAKPFSNGALPTAVEDKGLYIAGDGSHTSKALLNTYDGFVYAIPLLKINRRNSGGYSVKNPNGAREFFVVSSALASPIAPGATGQLTLNTVDYARILTGDLFYYDANYNVTVISKDGGNKITIKNTGTSTSGGLDSVQALSTANRPDGLYANIIAARDITDLRHKTYLVAPSYEQLLIDGTDQILRGASQVERPTAMRKTYVGVRKTPLDANHVFYASFDGTSIAEVGGPTGITGTYLPSLSGSSMRFPNTIPSNSLNLSSPIQDTFTIDFILEDENIPKVIANGGTRQLLALLDSNGTAQATIVVREELANTDRAIVFLTASSAGWTSSVGYSYVKAIHGRSLFIRITRSAGITRIYVNGVKVAENATVSMTTPATKLTLGKGYIWQTPNTYFDWQGGSVSDFSISNVDRGTVFATLPADFILGYADITPALTSQRRINSDAPTAQKTYAVARVQNQTQERGITVTKGTGVNAAAWEAGDKIKVRGLAGEIIGGVIDSDTALTKINSIGGGIGLTWPVNDVSKVAVSDTCRIWDATVNAVGDSMSITGIDATAKTVTFSTSLTLNHMNQYYLVETTASTSSPLVRVVISGTSITVPGTWTGLGTNEAELTMGTLPGGLIAQDIIIEYSLNMPVGQGGLHQVYTSVLAGEANGKKLVPSAVAITDDFVGKIAGSTAANPNRAYHVGGTTLATPSAPGAELSQADYDAIKSKDASLKVTTVTGPGNFAQNLFSFDIIRMFEDKYGKIPGAYTVTEKVSWLAANIARITFNAHAYGAEPVGNYVSISARVGGAWSDFVSHPYGIINPLTIATLSNVIDAAGFVHYLVFAGASDGAKASSLFVDSISVEITLTSKAGYISLVPENSRRDDGLGSILYIRRTTREVESLFAGNDEDNGIVVYGDYLPMQDMATTITAPLSGTADVLLSMQGIVSVAGTNKAYGDLNSYSNAIARLVGPGDDLNYKVDPQSLMLTSNYTDNYVASVVRYTYADSPNVAKLSTAWYTDDLPEWCKQIAEFFFCTQSLVTYNGELLIRLQVNRRSRKALPGLGGGATYVYYRLPGRPLIKL